MVERQTGRVSRRTVSAGINFAARLYKPPQKILHVSITLQKLFAIGCRSLVGPVILTERDEPFVERHVLKQRIVEQTRVLQLKLRSPVDDAFPFEVERGIQVHVALNEILNHFVKD